MRQEYPHSVYKLHQDEKFSLDDGTVSYIDGMFEVYGERGEAIYHMLYTARDVVDVSYHQHLPRVVSFSAATCIHSH